VAVTDVVLAPGTSSWADSPRRLARTIRARDGRIYAMESDAIVELAADDTPRVISTCGTVCNRIALAGTDAEGALHLIRPGESVIEILDPDGASARTVELPSGFAVDAAAAGTQLALVTVRDVKSGIQSAWMLPPGGDELVQFAMLESSSFQPLVDSSGTAYLAGGGLLQRVVVNE
jgi:hypothetical protein